MHLKKVLSFFLFCFLFSSVSLADECKLTEFKKYADKLDKTKIESVELLTKKYRDISINQSQNCISNLFSEFQSYYYQFMVSYEKTIRKTLLFDYPLRKEIRKRLEKELNKAGWKLRETEGSYYIGENGSWFIENFGDSLPDDWKNFLQLRKKEIKKGFSEDAHLLVSWDKLRARIIYWEDFLKKYPSFQKRSTVEWYLSIYFRTYLTGMDNSRISDYENKIYKEVIKSYENYIRMNKKSKYYKIVEGQYNILKKNSFIVSEKTSEELNAFYKANNIKSMLGVQPPIY